MSDNELGFLNYEEYLKQNINCYLEAFVQFYGEDSREFITEKFKNAIYIEYQDINETKNFIYKLEKKYTKLYFEEELKKAGIDDQSDKFIGNYSFENECIMPLSSFKKFYELYMMGFDLRKKRFVEIGLELFKKVKSDITIDEYINYMNNGNIPQYFFVGKPKYLYNSIMYYMNINNCENEYSKAKDIFFENFESDFFEIDRNNFFNCEVFNKYKTIYECYKRALIKYEFLQKSLKPFKEYVCKSKSLEESLHKKYYKEFVYQCSFLFNDEELSKIDAYFNSSTFLSKPECLNILSYSLNTITTINSFSENSQKKLDNIGTSSWERDLIIDDRIKYFKAKGIDFGNDYQLYLNSVTVKSIWPSNEIALKVEKLRENYNTKFNEEYYCNISRYKEIKNELSKYEFVDKESINNAINYISNSTFVLPNSIIVDNDVKLFPLVNINVSDNNYLDHYIVHELNHLCETSIISKNGKIKYISGWDVDNSDNLDDDITDDGFNNIRKYELFNEAINELIAQDISKIMASNNIFVFNDRDNTEYKGSTSYEQTNFLINEFYHEFFDDIIASRKNGNIQIIFDRVGKENFDSLNRLFNVFRKNFKGNKYYKLRSSVKNNEKNLDTKLFYEIIEKKNEILNSMRNYNKKNISK